MSETNGEHGGHDGATVRVELLGPANVQAPPRRTAARPGKKALALLAYLICHPGQEIARERLAGLLWPDRFEEQARQSLRQALTALRRLFGAEGEAALSSGESYIAIAPERVATDVAEFDALRTSSRLEDLIAAAALYRGAFLEQLGSVSEDFDAWAMQERQRRRAHAVSVLERLIQALRDEGRHAEAAGYAEQLVAADPAHEPGHRALMALYAAIGQRSAALRQFEACRRALAQHLDAEPAPETVSLYESIRDATNIALAPPSDDAPPRKPTAAPHVQRMQRPGIIRFLLRRRLVLGSSLSALAAATLWLARVPPPDPPQTLATPSVTDSCLGPTTLATTSTPALLVLPLRFFGDGEPPGLFIAAATNRIQSVAAVIPDVTILIGPPAGHADLALSPVEIAAKTQATHVLDGGVRETPGALEITLRLIDGETGRQLWQSTTRYAAPLTDPASVQDALALAAARGVQEQITDGRQALVYPRYEPSSLEVWEHNTRGYGGLAQLDPLANMYARGEFEAALALAPENAGANTGLAFTYLSPVVFRWSTEVDENLETARLYAATALANEPEHPAALSALSIIELFDGEHARAVQLGEQSVRLSGGGGDATAFLAYVLSYTEEAPRGVESARRAIRLRPYAAPTWYEWTLARALRLNRETDAAIDCLERIDYGAPGVLAPALELIQAYDAAGEPENASPLADIARAQAPETFSSRAYCERPAHVDARVTQACLAALTMAGLPD